ncbi:MAG: DUF5117 domain-containing protein [Thermoanaerobaculia bacterium]|nr:DUF5117 domain-containing protein [Thermoanaerobaculia bacterium]
MSNRLLFSIPLLAGLAVACASGPPPPVERPIPDLHPGGEERLPPLRAVTGDLARREGLLATYVDSVRGRLLLELPAPLGPSGELGDFLYVERLVTGLGLAEVPLDRGQGGNGRLLRFRRVGGRVLAEAPNLAFRAPSGDETALRAVAESFAPLVLWGGEVLAEDAESGAVLVDFTPFVVRDAVGLAAALPGSAPWSLDPARSGLRAEGCRSFPDNLELEAVLTFAGPAPPAGVVAAGRPGEGLAFVQRISLLALPGPGYAPLAHDPRAGALALGYEDLSAPSPGRRRGGWRSATGSWRQLPGRSPRRGRRSSTTSTARSRSRSAPRCWKGPAGGRRPSRRSACPGCSGSISCRRGPIRSMPGTTSSSGSTAPRGAGRTAAASSTLAPGSG